ncbi:AAA family ATPase [Lysinibacillus sp. NPDC096418]|uniref:AAA family ATPase n=1 Tax=Lysinibacillus sp. NPDC096418 TaxID=3364138 RepID=UPI003809F9DD
MDVVKIKKVTVHNLKNVRNGEITLSADFDSFLKSNVVGLYGQNGSGKTTMVDAFNLLKTLISGWISHEKLQLQKKRLITAKEETASLDFDFLVQNEFGEFYVNYFVAFQEDDERIYTTIEKLSYRENEKGKRSKTLIYKDEDVVQIRTTSLKEMNEKLRVKVMVVRAMAQKEHVSFAFHKDLKPVLQEMLNETEWHLLNNIAIDFNRDLHVITNQSIGLLMMKYIMPFSVHLDKSRGFIPYDLEGTSLLQKDRFEVLCKVIDQTNKVLSTIIPELTIKIHFITEQILDNGELGVRFEFLSKRGEYELPLRTESEGILKIISVLSALIAVYNNANACVVIDELDSGVFEYLLGELLTVIDEAGKGQLIFTSHNLRVLEVLPVKNLWFTTANEHNRYVQLKGIKEVNNTRDVYLRAIQLGGQAEEIYKETKTFHIKRAFRKAGVNND